MISLDVKLGPILGPIFVSVALLSEHDYEMSIVLLREQYYGCNMRELDLNATISLNKKEACRVFSSLLLLPTPSPTTT